MTGKKLIKIKLTAAIAVAGVIKKAGTVLSVADAEAKDLMHRGRAELVAGESEKALGSMNVVELKAVAAELDIEGADGMNKAKLIAAIEEERATAPDND